MGWIIELVQTMAPFLAIVAAIGTVGSLLLQRVQIMKLIAELEELKRQKDLQHKKLTLEVERLEAEKSPLYRPSPAEVDNILSAHRKEKWGSRIASPVGISFRATLERAVLLVLAYSLVAATTPAARAPGAVSIFLVLLLAYVVSYHRQGTTLWDRKLRLERERADIASERPDPPKRA